MQTVQLHEVEGGDAQVLAAPLGPVAEVGEGVVGDVDRRPPADLGGHHEALA